MKREKRRKNGGRVGLFVLCVLAATVLLLLVYSAISGEWGRAFTGAMTLTLLCIPPLAERGFSLRLPTALEVLAYVFVFCAGVLGETFDYYQRYPAFDSLLHTANGFMFAAFGFCLFELFEGKKRQFQHPSAGFLSFTAFCFSATVGVAWEILEFTADRVLHTDMQKDSILHRICTVKLTGGEVEQIRDIVATRIYTASGETVEIAGYLDVGLFDTVEDLFVNLIGAAIFCAIGYCYLRRHRRGMAGQFIPVVEKAGESAE